MVSGGLWTHHLGCHILRGRYQLKLIHCHRLNVIPFQRVLIKEKQLSAQYRPFALHHQLKRTVGHIDRVACATWAIQPQV